MCWYEEVLLTGVLRLAICIKIWKESIADIDIDIDSIVYHRCIMCQSFPYMLYWLDVENNISDQMDMLVTNLKQITRNRVQDYKWFTSDERIKKELGLMCNCLFYRSLIDTTGKEDEANETFI